MAANMFGERAAFNREPAWWGIGKKVFTEPMTATEAMAAADMGYVIHKVPLYAYIAEVDGTTAPRLMNKVGLFREPTADAPDWASLGIVGADYGLVQNMDVARFIDPLTGKWPVETVGAIGEGETIFLTLTAGSIEIKGEEIKQFLLYTDTRTGLKAAEFAVTDVRVVCQNTLMAGLRAAKVRGEIRHDASMSADLEWKTKLMDRLQGSLDAVAQAFGKLAEKTLTAKMLASIIEASYPEPAKSRRLTTIGSLTDQERKVVADLLQGETEEVKQFAQAVARVQERRKTALANYERVSDLSPAIAGTAWAAYNAIVEIEDYESNDKRSLASVLFGGRAKTKELAFAEAMAVVR